MHRDGVERERGRLTGDHGRVASGLAEVVGDAPGEKDEQERMTKRHEREWRARLQFMSATCR